MGFAFQNNPENLHLSHKMDPDFLDGLVVLEGKPLTYNQKSMATTYSNQVVIVQINL